MGKAVAADSPERWEYRLALTSAFSFDEVAHSFGEKGWELVSVVKVEDGRELYFKRRLRAE